MCFDLSTTDPLLSMLSRRGFSVRGWFYPRGCLSRGWFQLKRCFLRRGCLSRECLLVITKKVDEAPPTAECPPGSPNVAVVDGARHDAPP